MVIKHIYNEDWQLHLESDGKIYLKNVKLIKRVELKGELGNRMHHAFTDPALQVYMQIMLRDFDRYVEGLDY